tara:strand:+ start:2552 stop:3790 length:1239 start_codon:yes stop_codon:yes gene_type:complete
MCLFTYPNRLYALLFLFFSINAYSASIDSRLDYQGWGSGEAHDTERRISSWVARGAEEAFIVNTINTTNGLFGEGTDSWVYKLAKRGDELTMQADEALAKGDKKKASNMYKSASAHYGVARYPFLHSPSSAVAYEKHNKVYYQFLTLSKINFELVRVPLEGKQIIGNLYKPNDYRPKKRYPLVVISGGIDTWKNELWPTVAAMLAQNFLVFAMDMPGTGESEWKIDANSERIYKAAVEYLKHRPDVDSDKMAVFLRSFAGHFAVKLALTYPDIKAAVNVAGPITFGDGELWPLPEFMLRTVGAGFGIPQTEFDVLERGTEILSEQVSSLSLRAQGLMKETKGQAHLLTINGTKDQLVPTDEIFALSLSGVKQELWLYPDDGHCAGKNAKYYLPKSATWLKNIFSLPQSTHQE